jgi:tetratricopeptide (TPR) repeat protein
MVSDLPKAIFENIYSFTGRTWLLAPIIEWMNTEERLFLLSGEPGTGKSMIAAWLSGAGPQPTNSEQQKQLDVIRKSVAAIHFCQVNAGSTSPKALAKNMAEQLVRNIPGFGEAIAATMADQIKIQSTQNIGPIESGASVTGVYIELPDLALFCSACGAKIIEQSKPVTQMHVNITVDTLRDSGKVTGIEQIKAKLEQGDYVERQTIINLVLAESGPEALNTIAKLLATLQGVDQQALQKLGTQVVPEHVSRQIAEVVAAQQEVTAQGVQITAATAYHLGMLAAYDRKYDMALGYFRQATQADPEYSAGFAAIAWLQQSRAQDDLFYRDLDAAVSKLADAREAGAHTDPLDPSALALRGYIAKTLAQVAEARRQPADRQKYYSEAARLFEHAAQLNPTDASAQNGLGNIQYALGNLDAAITAYRRGVTLAPSYTAAYHDLALAYEGKR